MLLSPSGYGIDKAERKAEDDLRLPTDFRKTVIAYKIEMEIENLRSVG